MTSTPAVIRTSSSGSPVASARARPIDPEIPAADLSAEGGALEIEEPCGALEVGQRVGVHGDQAFELGAGGQLETQGFKELGIMPLEDAEQVGDVPATVVDDLGPRPGGAAQEDAPHANEGLGIGGAGGGVEDRADAASEVALSAQPRGDGRGRMDGGHLRLRL